MGAPQEPNLGALHNLSGRFLIHLIILTTEYQLYFLVQK